MLNFKFIHILKTISKDELKLFKKFISSPLYNNNKLILKLFTCLKKYHPYFYNDNLTKDYLFKCVYTGEKYNDKKLRNLSSEMLWLLEQFLFYLNIKKNKQDKEIAILEELTDRGLDKLVFIKHKKLIKEINKDKYKNLHAYYNLLKLIRLIKENKFYSHLSRLKYFNLINEEINLTNSLNFNSNLSLLIEMGLKPDLQTKFTNTDYILNTFNFLKNKKDNDELTQIFVNSAILLKSKNPNLFKNILKFYEMNQNSLNIELKSMLRSVLIDYLLNNNPNKIEITYYKDLLLLMGEPEEHLFGGYIRDNIFNHYVILYLYTNQLNKCLEFINNKNKYIKPEIKATVMNFNISKFFFYKKDYIFALEHASKIKNNYWWYYLNSLCTIIICNYELNEIREVKKTMKKLSEFINKNNEIIGKDCIIFKNFRDSIGLIINYKNLPNSTLLKRYHKYSKYNTHKNWLDEKIKQLVK